MISIVPIAAGAQCAAGGELIKIGVDTNGNGILDSSEVQQTAVVCNGSGCVPGAVQCAQNGVQHCNANAQWDAPVTCGGATPACLDGTCVACMPAALRCSGAQPQICDSTGDWSSVGLSCATAGQSCCDGACVDLTSNPNSCGACGVSCGGGACCMNACVDSANDSNNCGGCGIVCSDNQPCRAGTCLAGFGPPVSFAAGAGPRAIRSGDFNADGNADVAVANADEGTVGILLGNGDGTLRSQVTYRAGYEPNELAIGDFNADGKADLAVANRLTISVLLGNGDGTFRTAVDFLAGPNANPMAVAVGDFNGDGKLDLAAGDAKGIEPALKIMIGNGDGTFQSAVAYAVDPQNPYAADVAVADFNADGKADIALVGNGPGPAAPSIGILVGNGDGTFRPAATYSTAMQGVWAVATGSFFGTGTVDVAVVGYGVGFKRGNGDGTLDGSTTFLPQAGFYPPGSVARSVVIGNFARDGQSDVAVSLGTPGAVGVVRATGGSVLNHVGRGYDMDYPAGINPIAVTTGDFNGDGWPDLATGGGTFGQAGTVNVLLNTHRWIPSP